MRSLVVEALERAMRQERLRHDGQLELIRTLGRHAERLAIRVAAGAELYAGLKPQQAARALSALEDRGIVSRGGRKGDWFVIDPLLRRYLAGQRVEPLSFVRAVHDSVTVRDAASARVTRKVTSDAPSAR